MISCMVPGTRLELVQLAPRDFKRVCLTVSSQHRLSLYRQLNATVVGVLAGY